MPQPLPEREEFPRGDTAAGLERLRKRLLDLTPRNRLLHFRHPRASSLRIVDELPNVIFQRLVTGHKLAFKPVPDSPLGEYLPGGTKPEVKDYATKLGIATSFDLPQPGPAAVATTAHHDRFLQTLHYSSDLDTLARRLANAARTSIEESGANMLYLVLGFLEWFEEDNKEQARQAPLLTIPVSMERERSPQGGPIRNSLEYTGEDLEVNLCLAEKLRQDFSLELPRWDGEEDPEDYFSRVQRAVAHKRAWKVRRWATVCLLYFGKQLMYLDLDAKRWPHGKEIHKHPIVHELFEGPRTESPLVAEDYEIDSPAVSRDLPLLVCDADSSQHSALVDAVRGKNLVIQGPPGTGKSQTITNLISAALANGKTVLFVSEKLAALEVVRRNLDKAGLGIFCLELHSHKTQKQQLMKDLEERLNKKNQFGDPTELYPKIQALNRNKQELLDYVALINSPFGGLGRTIFRILWERDRRRAGLPFTPELGDGIVVEGAERLSLADLEGHRQVLDICGIRLAGLLRAHGSLPSHPWYGVCNPGLEYFAEGALISLLQSCLAKCRELEAILAQCGLLLDLQPQDSVQTIQATARQIRGELPSISGGEIQALLPRLAQRENRTVLRRFLAELASFHRDEAVLLELVSDWTRLDSSRQAQLRDLAASAAQLGVSDWDANALAAWANRLEDLSAAICETIPFVRGVLELLDGELSFALDDVGTLVAAIDLLLTGTPFDVLPLRRTSLEQEAAAVAVRAASQEAAELRSARQVLEAEFRLDWAPSVEELRLHVAVIESSGLWQRWFGSPYRASRRFFRRIRKRPGRPTRTEIGRGLGELLAFCERRATFRGHFCWSFIGSLDRDIDAPWDDLLRLVDWYQQLHARLPTRVGFAGRMARALCATRTEALREIARVAESGSDQLSRLRTIAAELRQVAIALPTAAGLASGSEPEAYAARLNSIAEEMRFVQSCLAGAGVRQAVRLREIPAVLERVNELASRKAMLDDDAAVRAILCERHAGIETDTDAVASTLDLAERIARSRLPPSLQAWLFENRDASKFATAAGCCEKLVRSSAELETLWSQFESQAMLDSPRWFRLNESGPAPALEQMRSRLEEALGSQPGLSEWLEYLRAGADADRLKLGQVLELAEQGEFHPGDLVAAYDYAVCNCVARRALEKHPRLMRFNGVTHEKVRRDFVRLDEEVMQHYQARVACLTDRRPVPNGVHQGPVGEWTELALIQREIAKMRKHIKIRQLVGRAHRALLALKPCFMMGPLSVAQYLPPGEIEFDLVVMDEASQLKSEDAMGAIARGKQIVIVGDKQQLPPTTFFERAAPEEELSELEILSAEEGESIIEVAESVFQPVRRLNWHYRSRHHSLIAFSNQEFYDEELIVFPAAYASDPDLGVSYIPVTNGIWDGRRNTIEAHRVVDAVLEHMARRPNESLGVAAMNFPQCELIDEMLDKEFQRDPVAQRYLEKWEREAGPFFVKNLENVQGDERDVIFVSMTYGRDARGNFYQRFGPVNAPKGYRRLNVLFTRAKKRTVVFSSMDPGSIRVDANSSRGTQILKAYLEYAKTGILQQPKGAHGGPESDFEVSVGQLLQAKGYEVVSQVGVAGFFIDIAVKNARRPGAYLLGIECDGASYHSGRSARDRDRLRQMILENLGWKIHRIWSTDWYKSRQREVDRLLSRIQQLLRDEEREEALRRTTLLEVCRERQGRLQLQPDEVAEVQAALKDDLRNQLLALKETIARECPDTAPEQRLLRDGMIEAFLQKRPTSQNEWLSLIPCELRSTTDLVEIRSYLPKVLEIFAGLAE
ncbi:MAG: DUF4011 domain-containing protein [Planctomycetota bacterium]